jgi:putative phosphoesterase
MKVAFLSDIHANLPALRAALDATRTYDTERIVVAGDIVGDGPHPTEVIQLLREYGVSDAIRGNVDHQVLELGHERKALKKKLGSKTLQKRNRAWTALQLAAADRDWLDGLPAEVSLDIGGSRVLVVHGSPHGDTDYIYPSITAEGLRGKLEPVDAPWPAVLVSGHSHVPFAQVIEGVLVVNCGSVGRPADGDPRGTFAVIDFASPERLVFGICRFAYPIDELITDLHGREVPGIRAEDYQLGIKR